MITGGSIYAALYWVNEQPAIKCRLRHTRCKIQFGRKRLLAPLVGDEFDAPQQSDAPYVTYRGEISQTIEL